MTTPNHCFCTINNDGNVTELCLEHQAIVDTAVASEREACAALVDAMAVESRIARDNFAAIFRPDDAYRHDLYYARAKQIAAAIRHRYHSALARRQAASELEKQKGQ